MTQDEIDTMWQKAMHQSIKEGEMFTRYQFAKLVADKATEEANARANASWTLMCKKMVAIEREAIYHIVSHSPFDEAFDDGELQSEIGDALKAMAFSICAAIRARGEQALAQLKQDGDCKKCKDGCPACDARKLQKEAHDLL